MGLLDALKAATADVQSEPKTNTNGTKKAAAKTNTNSTNKTNKPAAKATSKTNTNRTNGTNKTDSQKTKGGARYVIPKEFKQAIEDYLKGRPDMAEKLKKTDKSIDGCCDYIFDVMRKRAEKERGGKSAVGMYASPDEIFGMACHYYDETEESLKNELKSK